MRFSNKHITLIDPATGPNGTVPENAGDSIIYSSIKSLLEELFPGKEIIRISAHRHWEKKEKELIRTAQYCFAGGSNMMTSDIRHFPRFTPEKKMGFYLFPGVHRIILLGVGWYRYQPTPDLPTRIYYRNILNKNIIHSVRDTYAVQQLSGIRSIKVRNTSCPTVWHLDPSFKNIYDPTKEYTLLTLNNNYPDPESDCRLIQLILEQQNGRVVFFPQVQQDLPYLESLKVYQQNKRKFSVLDHSIASFTSFADHESFNYIGTRLHAGIAALQRRMPAIILAVDNRATEIAKDIRLWVCNRTDLTAIESWIVNGHIPPSLNIPADAINEWKNQFRNNC